MDDNPIIFKHFDVYTTLIDNLQNIFESQNCEMKNFVKNWFLTPPRFTTIRINSLLSSVQEVEELVRKSLKEEASRLGQEPPRVWSFPGLPELLVLDPWAPRPPPPQLPQREVVVDAACGAAVLRGAHVFAPGVLAVPSGTEVGDEVRVYADTAGKALKGLSVPYSEPGKMYVGGGVMRMSRKQLFQHDLHPKGVAVEVCRPASDVASVQIPPALGMLQNLPSVVCGRVVDPQPGDRVIDLCAAPGHKTTHLAALMANQNLPSVVCGRVVDPRPGDRVIDLCTAPGHKTTHLAALMANQGVLIALDKIGRKVESLKSLCKTMGADIVRAFTCDATTAVSDIATGEWEPPFAPGTFDHVLLDAPCSALGQRPQLGNRITRNQIASHPRLQKKLFDSAVRLVAPGGTLVYSTCSVTTEENEDIVSWALGRYPQIRLVSALPTVGATGSPKSSLTEAQRQMVQRFGPPVGPSPQLDTIGFFIAKFTKLS